MEKVIWALPKSVDVNGTEYAIRSDFRAVLDILTALSDSELSNQDKAETALEIFYPDFDDMPFSDYEDALRQCYRFIDRWQTPKEQKKQPVLMSWEQDFNMIIAPVNRIAGCEVRAIGYCHWWTFLSWYSEIGDCLFAQVVRIRDKKARGKALDKQDREFYKRNRDIIDLKTTYTDEENEILAALGISPK